jgi:hypothetical protein
MQTTTVYAERLGDGFNRINHLCANCSARRGYLVNSSIVRQTVPLALIQ